SWKNKKTVIAVGSGDKSMSKNFQDLATDGTWTVIVLDNETSPSDAFEKRMLDQYNADRGEMRESYHVGATFEEKQIIGWFNNYPFHAVPLILNMLYNAHLKSSGISLNIVNHPLPYTAKSQALLLLRRTGQVSLPITLGMIVLSSYFILFPVKERSNNAKHMQIASGANVHKTVGYCPQFDALIDVMTVRETLRMYLLLRGYPYKVISRETRNISKNLKLREHLDKKVKDCSGGNKRKLSLAIALIGDPPLVFLDEPTAGMDPGIRRQVWDVVMEIRESGNSVILTTHRKPVTCVRPVLESGPSCVRRNCARDSSVSVSRSASSAQKPTPTDTWLCRLRPTPGRSSTTGTPTARSSSAGPTPDSSSSCGDATAPADSTTSLRARTRRVSPLGS
ncbi:Protein scarlet, partial [Gryllus bimaculatus]